MPFDENGFLGDQASALAKNIFERHKNLFALCYEINRFAEITKYEFSPHSEDRQELVSTCLYIKFSLNMRSETIDCDVEMEDNQIFIRVSPEQVQEASTIFLKFDQWTRRFIYPRWLYWWRQFRGFHFLVILTIVLSVATWGIANPGNKEFKIEVNQLIEDGLSEEEIPRALELLLISKSGQTSKTKSIQIKPLYKTFLIVSLAVAIIGSFPPTSRIAIGKGIISIQRQKKWLKFISVVLPSFIAMGILASAFGSALYEYFK